MSATLKKALHETILEGGPLPEEDCKRMLAGKAGLPEMKAVLSRIEYAIGTARQDSEVLGQPEPRLREALGAVVHLRILRQEIIDMLKSERRAEGEES